MNIHPVPEDYRNSEKFKIIVLKVILHKNDYGDNSGLLIKENKNVVYKNYECYEFDDNWGSEIYDVNYLVTSIYSKKYERLYFNIKSNNQLLSFKIKCIIL